jgi:hypothetical protein
MERNKSGTRRTSRRESMGQMGAQGVREMNCSTAPAPIAGREDQGTVMNWVAVVVLLSCASASAETVRLLCRASTNGRPSLVRVVQIDFDAKKVDGVPAQIGSAEIKWNTRDEYAGTQSINVHTLNRLAGTLQTWPESGVLPSIPPLFTCERAPAPKF